MDLRNGRVRATKACKKMTPRVLPPPTPPLGRQVRSVSFAAATASPALCGSAQGHNCISPPLKSPINQPYMLVTMLQVKPNCYPYRWNSHNGQTAHSVKRPRILFTPQQSHYLEERFQEGQFPSIAAKEYMANVLELTPQQINIWFQNRRARTRRQRRRCKDDEPRKLTLKPPSFWPQNLPFDSNFIGILNGNKGDKGHKGTTGTPSSPSASELSIGESKPISSSPKKSKSGDGSLQEHVTPPSSTAESTVNTGPFSSPMIATADGSTKSHIPDNVSVSVSVLHHRHSSTEASNCNSLQHTYSTNTTPANISPPNASLLAAHLLPSFSSICGNSYASSRPVYHNVEYIPPQITAPPPKTTTMHCGIGYVPPEQSAAMPYCSTGRVPPKQSAAMPYCSTGCVPPEQSAAMPYCSTDRVPPEQSAAMPYCSTDRVPPEQSAAMPYCSTDRVPPEQSAAAMSSFNVPQVPSVLPYCNNGYVLPKATTTSHCSIGYVPLQQTATMSYCNTDCAPSIVVATSSYQMPLVTSYSNTGHVPPKPTAPWTIGCVPPKPTVTSSSVGYVPCKPTTAVAHSSSIGYTTTDISVGYVPPKQMTHSNIPKATVATDVSVNGVPSKPTDISVGYMPPKPTDISGGYVPPKQATHNSVGYMPPKPTDISVGYVPPKQATHNSGGYVPPKPTDISGGYVPPKQATHNSVGYAPPKPTDISVGYMPPKPTDISGGYVPPKPTDISGGYVPPKPTDISVGYVPPKQATHNSVGYAPPKPTDISVGYMPPKPTDISVGYMPPNATDISGSYVPPNATDISVGYVPPKPTDVSGGYMLPNATDISGGYVPPKPTDISGSYVPPKPTAVIPHSSIGYVPPNPMAHNSIDHVLPKPKVRTNRSVGYVPPTATMAQNSTEYVPPRPPTTTNHSTSYVPFKATSLPSINSTTATSSSKTIPSMESISSTALYLMSKSARASAPAGEPINYTSLPLSRPVTHPDTLTTSIVTQPSTVNGTLTTFTHDSTAQSSSATKKRSISCSALERVEGVTTVPSIDTQFDLLLDLPAAVDSPLQCHQNLMLPSPIHAEAPIPLVDILGEEWDLLDPILTSDYQETCLAPESPVHTPTNTNKNSFHCHQTAPLSVPTNNHIPLDGHTLVENPITHTPSFTPQWHQVPPLPPQFKPFSPSRAHIIISKPSSLSYYNGPFQSSVAQSANPFPPQFPNIRASVPPYALSSQ